MKRLLLSLLISSTSFYALANDQPKVNGFYVGAGFGSFGYSEEDAWNDNNNNLLSAEADGNSTKIYLGYQFNKIVGIEGTYTDYGTAKAKIGSYSMKPTSISLAANLGYTFKNGIRPFGLVGMSSLDLNQSEELLTDDSGAAFKFGFGVEYTPKALGGVQFRAAYEMDMYAVEYLDYQSGSGLTTETNLYALDSLYLGASYKF
ncbi:outer membrane beta-barrel protein [Aliivibrio fischeri]|uniref:Outer membrane beta-barrel protein n=1 Tax=Aliivibrio fischeri TaxID=668 RepID=A0A844P4M6_ALIFS|nr:outer membrane beta-barrel protein [Aliivibrio fischeri]MUK50324.1 outer membrane beta-barrel protein [Aliivibrio fischeri]